MELVEMRERGGWGRVDCAELEEDAAGISLRATILILARGDLGGETYNLPRPLEPSAMVRLRRSFLMWIATCWVELAMALSIGWRWTTGMRWETRPFGGWRRSWFLSGRNRRRFRIWRFGGFRTCSMGDGYDLYYRLYSVGNSPSFQDWTEAERKKIL
jgi:hypothetical protein